MTQVNGFVFQSSASLSSLSRPSHQRPSGGRQSIKGGDQLEMTTNANEKRET